MSSLSSVPISPLRAPSTIITGHDAAGQSIIKSQAAATWTVYDNEAVAFSVPYTTSTFPVDMNADVDIAANDATLSSGTLGLVKPGGTVCRLVDFAPGQPALMHRTQSLDYGIVLHGDVELVMSSGEVVKVGAGDVVVQRGTIHGWRNASPTEWARMAFVLLASVPLEINGRILPEDVPDSSGIPPSGSP